MMFVRIRGGNVAWFFFCACEAVQDWTMVMAPQQIITEDSLRIQAFQ